MCLKKVTKTHRKRLCVRAYVGLRACVNVLVIVRKRVYVSVNV